MNRISRISCFYAIKFACAVFCASLLITGAGLAQAETHQSEGDVPHTAGTEAAFHIDLVNNEGDVTGAVLVKNADTGSLITVEVRDLSPGWHGFHIHETGDCSDLETFSTAGGHVSFTGQGHGLLDEEFIHAGDMPNIWVHEDGIGKAQVHIADDIFDSLNDEDGSAFMIHSGPDDYKTDPAGAAGNRVACGVIFQPVSGQ